MPDQPSPTILFVNDFAPDSLAVADLVRQLLLGYPGKRLTWWYWKTSRIRNLQALKPARVFRWPLNDRFVPARRLTQLKSWFLENVLVPRAAAHLNKTISAVKPDVVWVLMFSWPILLANRLRLPPGTRLHVSLWDMPDTVPQRKILGERRCQRFMDSTYEVIRTATSFDAISGGVLEETVARTDRKDGIIVHSGFEPSHLQALETMTANRDGEMIRLAYVGTIISKVAFLELLAALKKVRQILSRKLTLEFYGARNYRAESWFEPEWMIEHGVFSDSELIESLQRCDWGIVVMDPEAQDIRYSSFSFPNKVGSYLSAGIPILGIGHARSSLARIMRGRDIGVLTNGRTRQELEPFLRQHFELKNPRAFFRPGILDCARSEFNASHIREQLWGLWRGKPSGP
jgi:hypothetical protein